MFATRCLGHHRQALSGRPHLLWVPSESRLFWWKWSLSQNQSLPSSPGSFSPLRCETKTKRGERCGKAFSALHMRKAMIWKVKFASYFEGLWILVSKWLERLGLELILKAIPKDKMKTFCTGRSFKTCGCYSFHLWIVFISCETKMFCMHLAIKVTGLWNGTANVLWESQQSNFSWAKEERKRRQIW